MDLMPPQGGVPHALIRAARDEAALSGRPVLDVLQKQLALSPADLVNALAATLHFRSVSKTEIEEWQPAFELLPYADAQRRGCVALRTPSNELIIAVVDPLCDDLQCWLSEQIKAPFHLGVIDRQDLHDCLARNEQTLLALDDVKTRIREEGRDARRSAADLSLSSISEDTSDVVRLVRSTLRDALKLQASDVHFETTASGLTIKFRIDGTLTQVKLVPDISQAQQAISRLKILAELDISEQRIPQDGRFKAADSGREIDFRVSIMPSIFGEDAVVRVLDKQALIDHLQQLTLDSLGFEAEHVHMLRRLSMAPYGMLLVTGPTGSGKTTTLYAAISEINDGRDKIVTIEDPVEYQLPGVLQIPVNEKKGLTFAVGLRSILRHDPDKIMVGEIRDSETANIAVQSALTGHQVFTTVHANNVFDVIGRFMHMNVDLHSFISALNGVVAQRLVRLNCPHCAEPEAPTGELLQQSGLCPDAVANYRFTRGRGCIQCRNTGYRGRKAIAETLVLNDELRELIIAREPIRRVKEAARAGGTSFLRDNAIRAVAAGDTTLQEINRVTSVL